MPGPLVSAGVWDGATDWLAGRWPVSGCGPYARPHIGCAMFPLWNLSK